MKKITSLFLAILLIFSLTACGETQPSSNGKDTTPNSNEENNSSNIESTESSTVSQDEITFNELIVVDNEECSIKITQIDADNIWGYTLKAQLENKSADKTYMFSIDGAAINGVQFDPFFASEVAAGKKSNEEITCFDEILEENKIGNYTDIELTFNVYDSNDWEADSVANEAVHIYPYGEDKAEKFVRESQASDNVILDNEYATVIVTGYEIDDIWGYTVNLFLLNKTDKNIVFSTEDVSINGFMADPYFADSVSAGKCAFTNITWSNTDFEDNNIETVETIEFMLQASNADDWSEDYYINEKIVLNP